MSRIPGWFIVVALLVLLFAPEEAGAFLGELLSGIQTAWSSV